MPVSKPMLLTIVSTSLSLIAGALGAVHIISTPVKLVLDGSPNQLMAFERTVGDLLNRRGIQVGEHDHVAPDRQTTLAKGMQVIVRYGREVTVSTNGVQKKFWTTHNNVNGVLEELSLDKADTVLSVPKTQGIGRDGLTFNADVKAEVIVEAGGKTQKLRAHGTVADAIKQAGFSKGENDRVEPAVSTPVKDGLKISIIDVSTKEITREAPVPFKTVKKEDPTKIKGPETVQTKGVAGIATETVVQYWERGTVVKEEIRESVITKAPVDEVRLIGTKPIPAGSHQDWMSQAGIAASDFDYVETLIKKESGWNPNAVNKSSGACGLVQALPCSKLGTNWNDPVVALKWGDSYVKKRYGGWSGAWEHSKNTGWY